jgi:CIC family chloride channel protein
MRRVYLLLAEVKFAPTEAQRLFVLTIVIGVVCGLAAVAFHVAIDLAQRALINRSLYASGNSWIGWTIATPTLGALVCGLCLHYLAPNARGSGIPQVKVAYAKAGGRLRLRDSVAKFLLGALQLGSGSSLGREGPTVQICAGVASALGRVAGVSPKSLRRLLPVGVAAGIAAAFNAPIAAVTFTIEEVVGKLDQAVLSGVIIAAALAAVIERSILGTHPIFGIPQTYNVNHASSLLIYSLLGVAAAIVSMVFTDSLLALRLRFRRSALPRWAQPAVGGLVTGLLAAAAMGMLGTSGVAGGGYETLGQALVGKLAVQTMLVLCAVKVAATVFSYSSGGAGGIFAPALFIGGTLGGAMGILDATLLHHAGEPIGAFALVGMGAVFAGIIRAPMTSVLIIVEMTGGYSLILPLMIANMMSYVLCRRFRPTPIYEALLEQDGIHLGDDLIKGSLEKMRLQQLVSTGARTFGPSTQGREVSERTTDSGQEVYPVIDAAGKLLGIITRNELDILASEPEMVLLLNAADLMRPGVSVQLSDDLGTALEVMVANGIRQVPVTDNGGKFVGFLDEGAIGKAYLRGNQGDSMVDPAELKSPGTH